MATSRSHLRSLLLHLGKLSHVGTSRQHLCDIREKRHWVGPSVASTANRCIHPRIGQQQDRKIGMLMVKLRSIGDGQLRRHVECQHHHVVLPLVCEFSCRGMVGSDIHRVPSALQHADASIPAYIIQVDQKNLFVFGQSCRVPAGNCGQYIQRRRRVSPQKARIPSKAEVLRAKFLSVARLARGSP